MTSPGIYPKIIELYALLNLIAMWSNKQQRRSEIISNFTKGESFFISYYNQVLLGLFSRWVAFSCFLIKRPSSPLQFGQEENIPGHSFERRAYWLVWKNCQSAPYSHRQNRKRMLNILIMVIITPICRRQFRG